MQNICFPQTKESRADLEGHEGEQMMTDVHSECIPFSFSNKKKKEYNFVSM